MIPATALPGDLLVHVPGTGGNALSNAFPFDPLAETCISIFLRHKRCQSGFRWRMFSLGYAAHMLDT